MIQNVRGSAQINAAMFAQEREPAKLGNQESQRWQHIWMMSGFRILDSKKNKRKTQSEKTLQCKAQQWQKSDFKAQQGAFKKKVLKTKDKDEEFKNLKTKILKNNRSLSTKS